MYIYVKSFLYWKYIFEMGLFSKVRYLSLYGNGGWVTPVRFEIGEGLWWRHTFVNVYADSVFYVRHFFDNRGRGCSNIPYTKQ